MCLFIKIELTGAARFSAGELSKKTWGTDNFAPLVAIRSAKKSDNTTFFVAKHADNPCACDLIHDDYQGGSSIMLQPDALIQLENSVLFLREQKPLSMTVTTWFTSKENGSNTKKYKVKLTVKDFSSLLKMNGLKSATEYEISV